MRNGFGRDLWLPVCAIIVSILAAIFMGVITLRIFVMGVGSFPEFFHKHPALALLQLVNFVIFGYSAFRKRGPTEGGGYRDNG